MKADSSSVLDEPSAARPDENNLVERDFAPQYYETGSPPNVQKSWAHNRRFSVPQSTTKTYANSTQKFELLGLIKPVKSATATICLAT